MYFIYLLLHFQSLVFLTIKHFYWAGQAALLAHDWAQLIPLPVYINIIAVSGQQLRIWWAKGTF